MSFWKCGKCGNVSRSSKTARSKRAPTCAYCRSWRHMVPQERRVQKTGSLNKAKAALSGEASAYWGKRMKRLGGD